MALVYLDFPKECLLKIQILPAHLYGGIYDPNMSDEELDEYFPPKDKEFNTFFGNVMVFPQKGQITKLEIPDELLEEPYFLDHNLVPPTGQQKISTREGFGNHFGTVNFKGEDPERMKELLKHYENVDFYL